MPHKIGSAGAFLKLQELYDFLGKTEGDDLRFSVSLLVEADGKTWDVELVGEFDVQTFRSSLYQDYILLSTDWTCPDLDEYEF